MEYTAKLSLKNFDDRMYLLQGLSVFAALLLTLVSYLKLCSAECAEGHKYLLYGMPFELLGGVFLSTLACATILQRKIPIFKTLVPLLFASAFGAEILFILIQKYAIGQWCPVCLGIAFCIALGTFACAAILVRNYKLSKIQGKREDLMKSVWTGIGSITAVFFGFLIAFMGITKQDALQSAQDTIRENIAFGNKNSKIEVYLFTDWACPACRKLEVHLDEIMKSITKDNQLIFVDHVIHPETLNFIPFNLSFILNNKADYLKLRDMLTAVSEKTGTPTEEEITANAAKLGVTYKELNFSDIALATKYYKKLGEKFKITGTPTLVIINTETKKGKKLSGVNEISAENVVKSIKSLQ